VLLEKVAQRSVESAMLSKIEQVSSLEDFLGIFSKLMLCECKTGNMAGSFY
jgi:hypothetical protein